MSKKQYFSPSIRFIHIQGETLMAASSQQIGIDHEEGVWEADANQESDLGSIWDTDRGFGQ